MNLRQYITPTNIKIAAATVGGAIAAWISIFGITTSLSWPMGVVYFLSVSSSLVAGVWGGRSIWKKIIEQTERVKGSKHRLQKMNDMYNVTKTSIEIIEKNLPEEEKTLEKEPATIAEKSSSADERARRLREVHKNFAKQNREQARNAREKAKNVRQRLANLAAPEEKNRVPETNTQKFAAIREWFTRCNRSKIKKSFKIMLGGWKGFVGVGTTTYGFIGLLTSSTEDPFSLAKMLPTVIFGLVGAAVSGYFKHQEELEKNLEKQDQADL